MGFFSNRYSDPRSRKFLVSRVIFYLIIIGIAAIYMRQMDKAKKRTAAPVVKPYSSQMPVKESELSAAPKTGMVILLVQDGDESQDWETKRKELADSNEKKYPAVLLKFANVEEAKTYFKADDLPCVIIVDENNEEIQRFGL